MSERRAYYERAASWALDTRALADRSRRGAWTVAGIAVAVALFEAVALAMLAPMKSVQTVTLLVDRQTGFVQAIDPVTPRRLAADDALTDAYLAQYVAAREGFDRATVAGDYRKVALWSSGSARSTYLALMPATNPASPFQRVAAGSTVDVAVKSVSRLDRGLALVRFDTVGIDRSGQRSPAQPWVAVVRFRYVDAPMSLSDRLVNPLGFQVGSYRRDAEVPPPATGFPAAPPPIADASSTTVATPRVTTVVETSRRVVRSAPVATPRTSAAAPPPERAARLFAEPVERRDVPINRLPLGSPLSPSNAAFATEPGTVRR